jgi:IclR family acetate operon transcriptional repressor
LDQVKQQGYAVDDEEYIIGVRCVAAPVFGLDNVLLGAIGISGPGTRVTLDRIDDVVKAVTKIALSLSKHMRFETV